MAKLQFGERRTTHTKKIKFRQKCWKKCKIREKTQQIKCPDPQGDGGRLESQCDPSSLMVAAVGTVAVLVDDTGGGGGGRGRVPGAGGCCVLPRAFHLVLELPEAIPQLIQFREVVRVCLREPFILLAKLCVVFPQALQLLLLCCPRFSRGLRVGGCPRWTSSGSGLRGACACPATGLG